MVNRNLVEEIELAILTNNFTNHEKIWLITDIVNLRRSLSPNNIRYLTVFERCYYNLFYGCKSRIFQSSLYLCLMLLASYLSRRSVVKCIQENSRFPKSEGLLFPGSLRAALKNFRQIRYWLPSRSKTVYIENRKISIFTVQKRLQDQGINVSIFFLLGSYLRYRIVENIVISITPGVDSMYTIGTIEPFQKFMSAYLLNMSKHVELYVHGIILDPIASYQTFSNLSENTLNRGIDGRDDYLLELLKGSSPKIKEYGKITPLENKLRHADFKGVDRILIFSTSVEAGMPILTPDSFIKLLKKIERFISHSRELIIRLHPGENRKLVERVIRRNFKFDYQYDNNSINNFDLAIGLPSTYIEIARERSKKVIILNDWIYNYAYFQ